MPSDRKRLHRNDLDHEHGTSEAPEHAHQASAPDLSGTAAAVERVQAKSDSRVVATDEDSRKEHAAAGIGGGGQALPHLDKIQASFGADHDLSGVRAHV